MRRVAHMIRKEFRQVLRDKPMLAIIFVIPIVQLLIFSFSITTEVKHTTLMVADLDRSAASRDLVRAFVHTEQFDLVGHTTDLREIREEMRRWQVQVGLIIPVGFGRDLGRGLNPQLQLVSDGVDGNSAGVATGYAQGILSEFGKDYAARRQMVPLSTDPSFVSVEERMWYNPDLSSQQFMVPGIVVVLLTILPMMLSAMSLVKEKEIGTLEQLSVTPLRKYELLTGKLIPFLFLSYLELAVVTTVAVTVFGISMNGSYLLLASLALLYLFTTLGLGIFISTITRSQQQAMFVAWFFMVFMIMMSGFFIPIENMPAVLQKLTFLNPMRYFMTIIRDIFQKGSSIGYLLRDVVPLAVFGLSIFSVSILKFRKRVG